MASQTQVLGTLPINRKEYSPTANYYKDNVVMHNNCAYYCKVAGPISNIEPGTENTNWGLWSGNKFASNTASSTNNEVVSPYFLGEIRRVCTNSRINIALDYIYINISNFTGVGDVSLETLKSEDTDVTLVLVNNVLDSYGLALYAGGRAIATFWQNTKISRISSTVNGIYIYAEIKWNAVSNGRHEGIIIKELLDLHPTPLETIPGLIPNKSISEDKLSDNSISNRVLQDNSISKQKILDQSITVEKLHNNLSTKLGFTHYSDVILANKVLNRVFIDTSNYNGSVALTFPLRFKLISKNVGGLWGVQIGNAEDQTVISAWMAEENPIYSGTILGIYLYIEYNWAEKSNGATFGGNIQDSAYCWDPRIIEGKVDKNNLSQLLQDELAAMKSVTDELRHDTEYLYGSIGDSITEGAGLLEYLSTDDKYLPITGTKKATYAYYIARKNGIKWANYGISGSTLGNVVANGQDKNGFSKENGRYTKLDEKLTHLSIFFGWNDSFYGPIMKKEDWLKNTYSKTIYYPRETSLIGTTAQDGTPYTTQEQYNAVNSVTGQVGGITYNNSSEYFNALYIGTESDQTNKTFFGAWNIVLSYLINKYPFSKILIVVPYGTTVLMQETVRRVASKYGLAVYDFNSKDNQLFYYRFGDRPDGVVGDRNIEKFRADNLLADGVHPNELGYKYLYPSINAKLINL